MKLELSKKMLFFGVVVCLGVLSSCLDKDDSLGADATVVASHDTVPHSDAIQDATYIDLDTQEIDILDLVAEDEDLFDVFTSPEDATGETQVDAELDFDVEVDGEEQLPKDPTDDPDQHSAFYSFPAWEVPPSSDDE